MPKLLLPLLVIPAVACVQSGEDRGRFDETDECQPPEAGDGREVSVEGGLPDGDWTGTLSACPSRPDRKVVVVTIREDRILTEFSTDGFVGTALDTFRFVEAGLAEWLTPNGEVMGTCLARGGTLACMTLPNYAIHGERTLRFLETELWWEERLGLGEETGEWRGALPPSR